MTLLLLAPFSIFDYSKNKMKKYYNLVSRICICGREFAETVITESDDNVEKVVRGIGSYCNACAGNAREYNRTFSINVKHGRLTGQCKPPLTKPEQQINRRDLGNLRKFVEMAARKGLNFRLTIVQ